MSENTIEIVAGGAVLALAVGFVIYAGQGFGFGSSANSYPLKASFQSAEGISVGTDVRLSGVKVGTVSDMALNPQTFMADATFSIQNNIKLPTDSAALVSSEGLLGGNYIELRPGGETENLPEGGEIEDTQGSISLIGLLMKFVGSSAEKKLDDTQTSTDGTAP